MHQAMCLKRVEKKQLLGRQRRLWNGCLITLKKQKQSSPEVFCEKAVFKIFAIASGKFSVKKLFLVVDRAVKLLFLDWLTTLVKKAKLVIWVVLSSRVIWATFLWSWSFLVKNTFLGNENTKLPLLKNVRCFCLNFSNYSWKSLFSQNILKCAEG